RSKRGKGPSGGSSRRRGGKRSGGRNERSARGGRSGATAGQKPSAWQAAKKRGQRRSGNVVSSQQTYRGQELPPPPVGADGLPFDIENELREESAASDEGAEGGEDPPPAQLGSPTSGARLEGRAAECPRGKRTGPRSGRRRTKSTGASKPSGRSQERIKQRPRDFRVREIVALRELLGAREGPYFIHRLIKKKLTTLEAIGRLAKQYDLPKSAFAYGGLKDKQSYSEQIISVRGESIHHRDKLLKVTCLGRSAGPVSSAVVLANSFKLTVRGLALKSTEGLPTAVEQVAAFGVPNYFDSQRFGSVRFGQGLPVRELVRRRPEDALRLLIAAWSRLDRSGDKHLRRLIKSHWGEWEWLGRRLRTSPYGRILAHLSAAPDDYWGAVGQLDRPLRALHLFSYQSLIWNRTLTGYLRQAVPDAHTFSVPYVCGEHLLFGTLPQDARDTIATLELPLVAPDLCLSSDAVGAAVEGALREEGIGLQDLELPEECGAFFKTEQRKALFFPDDLVVSDPIADECNEGCYAVELSFELPRGAYATLLTKRLFRS
ncbi:tRNA pseudouridine(13) synthase TruD, partial [Planctomycetota bacterium]